MAMLRMLSTDRQTDRQTDRGKVCSFCAQTKQ